MRLFGFELSLRKAAPPGTTAVAENRGGWLPLIREMSSGAWQRNKTISAESVLAHHAVYACVTLIASDLGKLRPKLVQLDGNGIWRETESSAFSPLLRRPNAYQNHIQFKEWWTLSKLIHGNTYALKQRDARGVVVGLHLLDPTRVRVLLSPSGEVYYELQTDHLAGITESSIVAPARDILHDRMNCLFHPLVGVSPLYAGGESAIVGLKIQSNSSAFFEKGSTPSGILTAPAHIDETVAKQLAERWQQLFSGQNAGRVAVIGNGMAFEPLRMTAVDAQTIEQLKWSAETVCSAFHVPPFKIGLGQMPTYQNGELLNQVYYSDCLQSHIESFEAVMDEGLGLLEKKSGGKLMGVELDIKALLRMDSATQVKTLAEGTKAGIIAPNEARAELDLPPVTGGESPLMQQQNYSLTALARRDASEDPFRTSSSSTPPTPDPSPPEDPAEKSWNDHDWDEAGVLLKSLTASMVAEAS